jgi:hypothetical protein
MGCVEYFPGLYTGGNKDITIGSAGSGGSSVQTAIFVPGVYYVTGSLNIRNKSCLRPAISTMAPGNGDGSGGVMFYFSSNNNSLSFLSQNSGDCTSGLAGGQTITSYAATTSKCVTSGLGVSNLPANLTSVSFTGSVLTAPCNAPVSANGMCAPNCSLNYGDPQGTADPAGVQRGLLFFQNRSATLNSSSQPKWTGGGNFFIVGNLYFHNSSSYDDEFSFQANGASGYFSGSIIVDIFKIGGNSALTMDLSSNTGFTALKAALLR